MSSMKITGFAAVMMLAMVTATGIATADDKRGRIISFDPLTKIIILEDGNAYMLQDNLDLASLHAGKTVVITYDEKDGRRIVTAYSEAK